MIYTEVKKAFYLNHQNAVRDFMVSLKNLEFNTL